MFPGVSLESLNMEDLASSDPILPTFHIYGAPQSAANPFDYTSRNTIPDYTLPNAYRVGNVPSIEARMDALSDETLFFIFFSQPRDVAQQRAAGELERREWRWHTVLRQWMRSDSPPGQSATATGPNLALVDMAPTIPAGAPRIPIDNTTEQGIFIFFDLQQWKRVRREFKLNINDIDGKTMPRGPLSSLAANGVAYIRSQPGHGT
ncbi:hypothetical protein K470DRAFT_208473 [Piedraia hortae CBS 480.64]|uniref:NOT2/NOT3/NOT5 C-terminal domain-containing protein n=1 Tax=Piedraia hortae CBS 480.64 TaxID=1314780 RepID=A0A6A7CBK2_9PEZI|nr:hypothetical protein K470DRAFT_208473 [Piedraia hortae CBS 480.64]